MDYTSYHTLLARLKIMSIYDVVCERHGGISFDFRFTGEYYQCSATNAQRQPLHSKFYIVKNTPEEALLWADDLISHFDIESGQLV